MRLSFNSSAFSSTSTTRQNKRLTNNKDMFLLISKVKYLESLPTILCVHLLFFFYNDYNNTILSYLILIR